MIRRLADRILERFGYWRVSGAARWDQPYPFATGQLMTASLLNDARDAVRSLEERVAALERPGDLAEYAAAIRSMVEGTKASKETG